MFVKLKIRFILAIVFKGQGYRRKFANFGEITQVLGYQQYAKTVHKTTV